MFGMRGKDTWCVQEDKGKPETVVGREETAEGGGRVALQPRSLVKCPPSTWVETTPHHTGLTPDKAAA